MAQLLNPIQYRVLLNSGSLKAFYDDVVYWEIATGRNRFFVTFMDGLYGIPNNKQESIGTSEISFPHVTAGNASTGSFKISSTNRVNAAFDAFLQNDETGSGNNDFPENHGYNGFIPITELRGTRFFETTLTGSTGIINTYQYEQFDADTGTVTTERTISASYFYPFSDHQLSILREEPTLIIDLKKRSELFNGTGEKGYAIIPSTTNQKVRDNLEYYLSKAGLIDSTVKIKSPPKGT